MATRTHRTVWNYFAGLVYTAVGLLTGLIATPLLLRWLGDDRVGAFRTALGWSGYLLLLDIGVGGALSPMFARAVAKDDAAIRAVFRIGLRAYIKVAAAMGICGLILGYFLPYIANVTPSLVGEVRHGFWLSQLGAIVVALTPFWPLALAAQRGYFVSALQAAQTLTVTTLFLLFAKIGWGLTGQFVALTLGATVLYFPLAIDGLRRYQLLRPRPTEEELRVVQGELKLLRVPTFVVSLCTRVGLLTDEIVIALFLGSPMVVPFFITQRLGTLAQSQIQSVGAASWAAMAELHVIGERDVFAKRIRELTTLVMVIGLASMVPICAYNHQFVARWVGSNRFAGEVFTILAVTDVLLLSLTATWSSIVAGTGHTPAIVRMNVWSAAINIVVSVVATWRFGLVGPLVGTMTAVLTTSIWWLPVQLQKIYGISARDILLAVAKSLLWFAPFAILLWWWSHAHVARGWIGLCGEMGCAAIAFLVLSWFAIFDEDQRAIWKTRLRIMARLPRGSNDDTRPKVATASGTSGDA